MVGKIPWKRKQQLTPVISAGIIPLTEEPGGLQPGVAKSQTRPSDRACTHVDMYIKLILIQIVLACHHYLPYLYFFFDCSTQLVGFQLPNRDCAQKVKRKCRVLTTAPPRNYLYSIFKSLQRSLQDKEIHFNFLEELKFIFWESTYMFITSKKDSGKQSIWFLSTLPHHPNSLFKEQGEQIKAHRARLFSLPSNGIRLNKHSIPQDQRAGQKNTSRFQNSVRDFMSLCHAEFIQHSKKKSNPL